MAKRPRVPEPRSPSAQAFRYAKEEYSRTRNPVYAWDVIAEALARNLVFPDWTREYLFGAAAAITRLSRDDKQQPRKGEVARAVAKCLGFSGRGRSNPFDAMAQAAHELMIAFDVYQCHTRNWLNQSRGLEPPHDWQTIFRDAAEAHHRTCRRCRRQPSIGTVQRYWRKHALQVIPPHLIHRAHSHKIDDILR